MTKGASAAMQDPDPLLGIIGDYVTGHEPPSEAGAKRRPLLPHGCARMRLRRATEPRVPPPHRAGRAGRACRRRGARPGTGLELDPVQAAYCIGCLIRWLDYNDTWLAAEWGHPSDNRGLC